MRGFHIKFREGCILFHSLRVGLNVVKRKLPEKVTQGAGLKTFSSLKGILIMKIYIILKNEVKKTSKAIKINLTENIYLRNATSFL